MQLLHLLQTQPNKHLVGLLSTHIKLCGQVQICCQDVNGLTPASTPRTELSDES